MVLTKKPTPKNILILGAAGHIGQPLAEYVTREGPDIPTFACRQKHRKAENTAEQVSRGRVLAADYEDLSSLAAVVKGIEGVFVISSSGMSESVAMTNLTTVLKQDGSAAQIIGLLGIFPESNPYRRILDESGLPVTYINFGASFIDNLWLQIQPVLLNKTFIWPEHRVPFLDPQDIAEVAGCLFLSDNAKHIGVFHTMNNGYNWLTYEEVAGILDDELGEKIAFDASYEGFVEFWGPRMGKEAERLWYFFKFEHANEEQWALNNFVEPTLGRKPTTVRGWIVEHKDALVHATHPVSRGE
ncbi:hypothetical protein FOPG_15895 [Fusarium oxysporum f. sp. conglutinans race 2 54008]|uniref:NAD(P)-binding domain-containing protein n=1 Tax=Fusarium oxysporum f. sp. conglutinans race 2 54008 TaxID=1089457 RepID=X0GWL3_FUSOX|nr:hypothetical protein FOPG_15895 [Fusarium oxysporum f. sp. conglutinans race 2 54008]KAG6986258.1 hypothetical protein FocnCong_v003758 [Fusarium oxysporum f. sp. conglutinans]